MAITELFALLGRAWPRLILYPGGLAACALVLVIIAIQRRTPSTRQSLTETQTSADLTPLALSAVAAPWLGLALLPLPGAASIGRSFDIVVLFALLEWPRVLAALHEARTGDIQRLATILNSYPLLVLSTIVLAQAGGTLDLGPMMQPLAEAAPFRSQVLHWLGVLAWTLNLPLLLGIGPFSGEPARSFFLQLGLLLRAIGLGAIAALPWVALLSEEQRWFVPLPVLLFGCVLWIYHRFTIGQRVQPWVYASLVVCIVLLVALLWNSAAALGERLA